MMQVKNFFCVLFIFALFQGCTHTTQTTSGKAYLKKYDNAQTASPKANGSKLSMEEQIRQAASVEPTLTFPARIGLARIEEGKLSGIPGSDLEAWKKTQDKLGSNFGEFVPLSPLVASMAAADADFGEDRIGNLTKKIRLGAARQHLDAVLVYEVYSKENSDSNLLSVGNLTIIGAFILPSSELEVEGLASGMVIDVFQGYPYGTFQTTVKKEDVSTAFGSRDKSRKMADQVKLLVAQKLAEESYEMFLKLRVELAEKGASKN